MLAVVTVLSRLPFSTPRLAHWDAVNYALGLHEFNVAAHQPHPPGSPYYILLGRVVLAMVGDDNLALSTISVVASALAVIAEYALARTLFGRRAALLAAVALASQSIFWGYGTMATPWTLLALLAILIGLVSARLACGRRRWVIPSAALMALASGFRLDATVLLGPLWLWAVSRAEPRTARRLAAVAVVAIGTLLWLVPVVISSGGWIVWSERLLALFAASSATESSVARQFFANTAITIGTLALAIGPAIVLSLCCDWRTSLNALRSMPTSDAGRLLLVWVLPPLAFLWLVDSTEPGHTLIFTGALCVLSAGLLSRAAGSVARLAICGALLVVVQSGVFLFALPRDDKPPAWPPNSALLNVTAPGLHQQQTSLDASLEAIQARFDPSDTVVMTVTGQNVYRFMMYYLPRYLVLQVDPAAHTILPARNLRQGNWQEASACVLEGVDVRHALLVVWTNSEPGLVPAEAVPLAGGGSGPFQTWELAGSMEFPQMLADCGGGGTRGRQDTGIPRTGLVVQ